MEERGVGTTVVLVENFQQEQSQQNLQQQLWTALKLAATNFLTRKICFVVTKPMTMKNDLGIGKTEFGLLSMLLRELGTVQCQSLAIIDKEKQHAKI